MTAMTRCGTKPLVLGEGHTTPPKLLFQDPSASPRPNGQYGLARRFPVPQQADAGMGLLEIDCGDGFQFACAVALNNTSLDT